MSKKKEIKQIFENLDVESSEANPNKSGPEKEDAKQESTPSVDQAKDGKADLKAEMLAAEQSEPGVQDSGLGHSDSEVEQAEDEAANLRAEMLATEAEGQDESVSGMDQSTELPGLPSGMPTEEQGQRSQAESEEESPDDALDDVRRSLLEEDAQEEANPRWWKRIGRSSRKKNEETKAPEEINMPSLSAMAAVDAQAEGQLEEQSDEYQGQLDELIDLLDSEEEEPAEKSLALIQEDVPAAPETTPESEKPADIEDLKKQAFQSRPVDEGSDNLTEVRSIALEGDEEAFVEVEATKQAPLEERLDAVENALKPYQRYISFGLAFVGLILAIAAVFLIYNVYQRSVARNVAATAVVQSNLPYPTSVQLPGGWSFNLGKGALQNGQWSPQGAEWLQGTEVCRWVALPWSRQLEAVVRTLNHDDPIQLGMSNNDKLTYNVYSIQQMSPEEMKALDSNKPCLLIVLAEPDAQKRWVLTALP